MAQMSEGGQEREQLARLKAELEVQRRIGFVDGLFQEDITIRTLMESLGQGVVIVDHEGYILLLNAAAEVMFGYLRHEVVGKHHDLLLPLRLQEVHRRHMADYAREPRIRPMGIGMELVGRRSDGVEFPVEIGLSFLHSKRGLIVLTVITDITRRRAAERTIQQNVEALVDMNEQLESFAYSVSHDLRSPLRALIGFNQILREEYGARLDAEGREYLERSLSSARKMTAIIDALLILSRVSRKEMEFAQIDLGPIARRIVEDLRQAEPRRQVRLSIPESLPAYGDENLLTVALTNLLSNAFKYTSRMAEAFIEFGARRQANQTIYFVKDNGVGFDMAQEPKLFLPFERLHPEREFSGVGIGLATVARVIKRHGGRIWAQAEVGRGATFFFTLGEMDRR